MERAATLRTKQKIFPLLLLTGVLVSSGPAYAGRCRVTRVTCGDARLPLSVPLRIFRNFLVVAEGQIGGAPEHQNFVLDTGTAPSIVNERLLRQLGLPTLPSTITALGKTMPTQAAVVPEIELGPILATLVPVRVVNLSRLERDLGIPIAGIIGLDVLSKSSFHLDYDKRELEFGEFSDEGIPVYLNARVGVAVAVVTFGGKTVRMAVDTGSDRVVLLGGNFVEVGWLALRNTSQAGTSLLDQGMRVQEFYAPDITLGGQHFSKDRAYFVPGSANPLFDGLLGVRALGFRGLSYDQASGTIYLQK
jgi:hypothetical protein